MDAASTSALTRRELLSALALGAIGVGFINFRGCRTKEQEFTKAPSAYAPYWYIDYATDSFIEVKNHLSSPLSILPILTLITGKSIKLDLVQVAPLSTKRVSLKSQAELKFRAETGSGLWGDGSRPNSLIGNAQLIPISPKRATSRDFSAWILIDNPAERLGSVSLFEIPGDGEKNILEGLWWLPYPDTQVYFALQNTFRVGVELKIELFSNGQIIRSSAVELGDSGFRLVNINNLLKPNKPPELGGVRFTYRSKQGQTFPGQIMGRGRLFQEKLGFSTFFMLHESVTNLPNDVVSELQAPAAYFGRLDKLLDKSKAYLHPHLIMRNIADHKVYVQATIHGRDINNKPTELRLKSLLLSPQSTMHVDLEEQRRGNKSNLTDGIAGLRLTHDGAVHDVIAELFNMDEGGKVVYYDAIRNLPSYHPEMHAAISFNLAARNRSFIILKNASDEPQKANVVLDYNDGKRQYTVKLPEIPPQQVEIVDIRRLRDAQIRDENGQVLPPDIEFGGTVVINEPGGIVVSDPTFFGGDEDFDDSGFNPHLTASCAIDASLSGRVPRGLPTITYSLPPVVVDREHRCREIQDCFRNHPARDYASDPPRLPPGEFGEEVRAMDDGVIVAADFGQPARPNDRSPRCSAVIVRKTISGNEILTVYCHVRPLPEIINRLVAGQHPRVRRGDRIGVTDNTGFFNDQPQSHVHIQVLSSRGDAQDTYERVIERMQSQGICKFEVEGCTKRQ